MHVDGSNDDSNDPNDSDPSSKSNSPDNSDRGSISDRSLAEANEVPSSNVGQRYEPSIAGAQGLSASPSLTKENLQQVSGAEFSGPYGGINPDFNPHPGHSMDIIAPSTRSSLSSLPLKEDNDDSGNKGSGNKLEFEHLGGATSNNGSGNNDSANNDSGDDISLNGGYNNDSPDVTNTTEMPSNDNGGSDNNDSPNKDKQSPLDYIIEKLDSEIPFIGDSDGGE